MEGEERRKRLNIRYHIFHGFWDFAVSCHVPASAVLFPDWSLTLYNNSVCTSWSIPTNSVSFFWICPESTASFLRWNEPNCTQHSGTAWTCWYTSDLWNSIVTVALEPSSFSAPKIQFIFDLNECWPESYHNLRSDNWMIPISSWLAKLHIHTLLCIYITEFCLVFFVTQLLNFSEQALTHITQKYCM